MNQTNTSELINQNMPFRPETIPIMLGVMFFIFLVLAIFYFLLRNK